MPCCCSCVQIYNAAESQNAQLRSCRSPDVENYTIASNGRLGRLLLDEELSAGSSSKSDTDKASQTLTPNLCHGMSS